MKKITIAIALCLSLSANAEVFKCVDAGGKIVYQDKPCPDDKGYFVDLEKGTNKSVEEYKKNMEQEQTHYSAEFKRLQMEQDREKSNKEFWDKLKAQRCPDTKQGAKIGMSKGTVTDCFDLYLPGRCQINRTLIANSVHEQWVCKDQYGRIEYFYFDQDVLTAIQSPGY